MPFTLTEAAVEGVPSSRTRASDLVIPFRGVRLPAGPVDDELAELRALARLLPGSAAFTHRTAARLWGLPLPRRLEAMWPGDVTLPAGSHRVRRPGLRCHIADRETALLRNGLRATTLGATWCDLASELALGELVQVGDAIVNREGWDVLELGAAADRYDGRRGRVTIREALPLVRAGSRSPRETFARLLFVEWGLPEPELNAEVHDGQRGWLGCVDYLWRARRTIAEYYGAVHGPSWKDDLARVAAFQDAGWSVVVITDDDLRVRRAEIRARLERLLLR